MSRLANLAPRLALVTVLALFVGLGLQHSLRAPYNEGPDEVAHFYFTRFVAHHSRLPLTDAERTAAGYKSDSPPLFHLLAGLAGRGINLDAPPFIKVAQNNPRLQLVVGHDNIISWRALPTEDPLRGEVLLWYLGRWVTLLCGLAGLVAIYWLARLNWPGQPWLAVAAVAVLAFLPAYLGISAVISYEPLLGALLTLYFALLWLLIRTPDRSWLYLAAGLLLSLAALTKYTPVPALPLLPGLVIWLGYRERWGWRRTAGRLALAGLGLALPLGGWLLYAGYYFGRVSEQGWLVGLISPFLLSDGSDETSLRFLGLLSGGSLGSASVRYNDSLWQWGWHLLDEVWGGGWLTWLFLALWAAALPGLLRLWRAAGRRDRLWLALLAAHLGLLLALPLLRFLLTRQAATIMGQHVLFPAAAPLLLLLLSGLSGWRQPGAARWLAPLLLLVAGLALARSYGLLLQRVDHAPWPIQTVPLAGGEEVLAAFGELALLDADSQAGSLALTATLHWRAEALMAEDYHLELTLLDAAGQSRARWLGQPLNGRYPTRAWQPGDRVRTELRLPIAGLPAGDYRLRLRVLAGEQALSTAAGDAADLGQVTLSPAPLPAANPLRLGQRELGYALFPAPLSSEQLPLYHENAAVMVTTTAPLDDEVRLLLVGPDERPHPPVDQTGLGYTFAISPDFASGPYRLRAELWAGETRLAQADSPPLLRVVTEPRQFQPGPIEHPLAADFAGYVGLLGYDLPQPRVRAGQSLPLTLHWQARRTIGADLVFFNHLIGPDGRQWAGRDRRARDIYSTMLWAPGEVVADPFTLPIGPDVPPGTYYLLVGLYLPVGEAPVSLPLVEDGQFSEVTHVTLGPIEVEAADDQP